MKTYYWMITAALLMNGSDGWARTSKFLTKTGDAFKHGFHETQKGFDQGVSAVKGGFEDLGDQFQSLKGQITAATHNATKGIKTARQKIQEAQVKALKEAVKLKNIHHDIRLAKKMTQDVHEAFDQFNNLTHGVAGVTLGILTEDYTSQIKAGAYVVKAIETGNPHYLENAGGALAKPYVDKLIEFHALYEGVKSGDPMAIAKVGVMVAERSGLSKKFGNKLMKKLEHSPKLKKALETSYDLSQKLKKSQKILAKVDKFKGTVAMSLAHVPGGEKVIKEYSAAKKKMDGLQEKYGALLDLAESLSKGNTREAREEAATGHIASANHGHAGHKA
ncbi:hypothetical protein [Candidatus Hepatobacter penaei]|uniref:hypothetical protein n=1 Tax=Candidatus Hepatobacter penaei TaxID=1274402 RepID=UPI0012E03428|nr:hypothetical protein [Candidatus Hepatobacter penaei]